MSSYNRISLESLNKSLNNKIHYQFNLYNAKFHGATLSAPPMHNHYPYVDHPIVAYTNLYQHEPRKHHTLTRIHHRKHDHHAVVAVSSLRAKSSAGTASSTATAGDKKNNHRSAQKLTWRSSHWIKGFHSDHLINADESPKMRNGSSPLKGIRALDMSSVLAIRRILLLYENLQFKEAGEFINRLNNSSFKTVIRDLPMDLFIEAVPASLPILEAIYSKAFICSNDSIVQSTNYLRCDTLVLHLVKFFALQSSGIESSSLSNNPTAIQTNNSHWFPYVQEKYDCKHPLVISTKNLLKIITVVEPHLRKRLAARKKAIDKAVEGMGHHGLVGTSDDALLNLHEALRIEFEKTIQHFKCALLKLDELSLVGNGKTPLSRSVSRGPAPIKSSHQRQLNLRQEEIQERLIKNKTLLNAVEPCFLTNQSLQTLLGILQQRIEFDKDVLFQFTQLRKEFSSPSSSTNIIEASSVIAPLLMRFSYGCTQVLNLLKEITSELGTEEKDSNGKMKKTKKEEKEESDISGYHSDSTDSANTILNTPLYITQHHKSINKYNTLLYKSGRIKKRRPSTTNNGQGVSSVENQSVKSESGASVKRNISHHGSSEWHSNDAHQSLTTSTQSSNLAQSPVVSAQTSSWTQGVPNNETETDTLRQELAKAKRTILELQEKEQKLKDRLAEQALRMLERGVRFENINLGERRPTALIRRYGSLYAQARVDTLDALENLPELKDADELKSKLLFSVVVLAFRSVQRTVADMKQKIRRVLQIPESADHLSNKDSIKELETSLNTYLRSTANTFDVSKNIEEVCTQIWATLYDYPCLKTCEGLTTYIKDCVRLAWSLSIQNPPFIIEYETLSFRRDMHVRFHTSDQNSETIKTYLWPCLLEESSNGPCITKGVVIT